MGGRGQPALLALPADLCLLLLGQGMHWHSLITARPQAHPCLQVDVDVYRTLAPTRAEPLAGNHSFLQVICSAAHLVQPPLLGLFQRPAAGWSHQPTSQAGLGQPSVWVSQVFVMCSGLGCRAHIVIWVLQGSCPRRPPALVCLKLWPSCSSWVVSLCALACWT